VEAGRVSVVERMEVEEIVRSVRGQSLRILAALVITPIMLTTPIPLAI
jgi:hypothetical protein